MNTPEICPVCRQPLAPSAPRGLCPECLLKAGFPTGTQAADEPRRPRAVFLPPEPAALAPLFPQLEILGFIGQGGMGAVYRARQTGLDRIVALKILPPTAGEDPGFAERFTREARALAQLSHPHIVAVHEFGQSGGYHYLLMEYVDGVNLRRLLQSGRTDPRAALAIVPQICDALQFAHDRGIVHRDIKPENILLDKTGAVKIADFGLAKMVGDQPADTVLTGARDVMGTPHYMAPEQVEHPLAVDHRADIYSVGVVFYQMLTGELPIGRFAVPSKKVQVDVRLDEIVLRALEKEPELRFQQASALRTEVETVAGAPTASPAPAARGLYASWRHYWDNRTHFFGWLGLGAAAVLALLLWRTEDKSPATVTANQSFVENQPVPSSRPITPPPVISEVSANQNTGDTQSTRPPAIVAPEFVPAPSAPVPAAPLSGASSLTAAEIANANYDTMESNPEILRLQLGIKRRKLAESETRAQAGLLTANNLQLFRDDVALTEAKLAGNRLTFARIALAAAERTYLEAKSRSEVGLITPLNLAEAQLSFDSAKIRLARAEAQTQREQAGPSSALSSAQAALTAVEAQLEEAKAKFGVGAVTLRSVDEAQTNRDIAAIRLREVEDQATKASPATKTGPAVPYSTQFDAIVEVTLGDYASNELPGLLDLETGRTYFQREVVGTTGLFIAEMADKYRERGIDISGGLSGTAEGVVVWGCIALPISESAWNSLKPAGLAQVLSGLQAGTYTSLPGSDPLPSTYAVITRSGRIGLVQILGFSDQPRSVRLRYKLIADSSPAP